MPDFNDNNYRKQYWHTSAHIMAHAVKRLYPAARLGIGPAIESGFYYDFDIDHSFTTEDLKKIEDEMKNIIREKLPLERIEMKRSDSRSLMQEKGETYKVELIDDLPEDEVISFYRQGDFLDLCSGPHLDNTGQVKAVKLLQSAGAYWRGSEKNKMLQRIYGISFPDKSMLKEYVDQLEEARRRDHNKLGRELGYFTTVDYIGQGLPIFLPRGAKVLQILQRFVEDEEEKRGFQITRTPFMAKSDLYKISGHWQHYLDGMFVMGDPAKAEEEEVLALRPMTCPFQFQAYMTRTRSYRDLPIRYSETSTLFRNESSGEMHGLIRVRQFTISEGHIICTSDHLEKEFKDSLDLANKMLKAIGLADDVSYRFSRWDPLNKEKYIGSAEQWQAVQETMKEILDHTDLKYTIADGEAAFYGPKLDIQIRNVFGKEDTLITVQIDFQLAERFGMEYIDREGRKRHPYIIHRTSIGCYERTLALLIEKFAGSLPLWMASEQARILPISEKHLQAADDLAQKMQSAGLRVQIDSRDEKIGKKIREAQMEKLRYMLILGDREIEQQAVAVRSRSEGDLGSMPIGELIAKLQDEVDRKS